MGVKSSVSLETVKTVEKTVVDQTVEGYESAYGCYFNETTQDQQPAEARSSLDDPRSCTD